MEEYNLLKVGKELTSLVSIKEYNLLEDIDVSRLTTEERRAYVRRMQLYLEYFQHMQNSAESSTFTKRIIKGIKRKETNQKKNEEKKRLEKYSKLMTKALEKVTDEPHDERILSLSGVAATNVVFGGAVAMGGGGFARGLTILGAAGLSISDAVEGMSDKQQAIFYKKMCETLFEVVNAFNVPEEIVKQEMMKTMQKINDIKEKYKDVVDEDTMAKLIQDECVVSLSDGIEGTKDCEAFKAKVLEVIGESAWNKMITNSQIFIVTAELLFDQWEIYEEGIDFGPICLSVSKALEVEVTRRYFIGYRDYLLRNDLQLSNEMYTREGDPKEADDYMLGNTTGITGYVVYPDTQKVKLIGRLRDENQRFLRYAKNDLLKGKSEQECVEIIQQHLLDIKNICQNYRNPAAHKQMMDKISARECLDYIIDVKKVLGKMLDDCTW